LESLYRYLPSELIQTYALYKPELFDDQYRQLFEKYSDCIVIREKDFSSDFLRILNDINTRYILFGVDDVVYFDSVDLDVIDETFEKFSVDIFGFSLRFNKQIINKSNDPIKENNISGQTVYNINWPQGRTPTTRYPFELCATIYKSALVKKIIKNSRKNNTLLEKMFAPNSVTVNVLGRVLKKHKLLRMFGYFYNPNTLESWNCRWCQNHAEQLPHCIYFQKLCASAIQVNMVNTSARSEKAEQFAEHTVESLNEKYKKGFRLDIDVISQKKPEECHCGRDYFRIVKKQKGQL